MVDGEAEAWDGRDAAAFGELVESMFISLTCSFVEKEEEDGDTDSGHDDGGGFMGSDVKGGGRYV
jgi:hypothetical protein